MKKHDSKKYSLFTGCLIPSKFPFIEKATRAVFRVLDIELMDIKDASCCPNQMAVKSSDNALWYTLAARNLCLAESAGYDIMSLCNGCYDTLKTVNSKLKVDDQFREKINALLAEYDLEFKGSIRVKHVVQVLHDDVGQLAIERLTVNPLEGFKCASFMGCHVKRPMDHMGFDDPEDPTYLSDLIKVIGGVPISYSQQTSCCGGGLSIGRKDDVVPAARRVLRSALEADAQALVVNCPFCFAQFFRSEKDIQEIYNDGLKLPIFYITQLMGLAFGLSPEELGIPLQYKISSSGEKEFVEELLEEKIDESIFSDEVTLSQLKICEKCSACIDDCQTAMTTSDYKPEEILKLVLAGNVDEVLKRDDIWFCMNCHECTQQCPQGFGMVKLISWLKNQAYKKGIYPEVVGHRLSELHESGYSFPVDMGKRKELSLPEIKVPDMTKLRKLIKETTGESSDEEGD